MIHRIAPLLILVSASLAAPVEDKPRRTFLAADESRKLLHYVDESDRARDWSLAGGFRDMQLIGDHRVALSDGAGLSIVDIKIRRIVATVRPAKARGTQSFRWMSDGRILIVAGGGVLTTDALGTDRGHVPRTLGQRICRTTADGGWISGVGSNIVDLAPDGTVRARIAVPDVKYLYHVAKRADGGYLAACGYSGFVLSLNPKGEILQRFEHPTRFFFAGLQLLDSGNLVVCNWPGHGKDDVRNEQKGPQLIEFTPDGKPVWTFRDPQKLGSIHHAIVLDNLDTALAHQETGGRLVPEPTLNAPTLKTTIAGNSLDGIACLPKGAMAVSVPNLNDPSAAPQVVVIAADGSTSTRALPAPAEGSERLVPFGMDAADDGTIYLADNQFFSKRTPKPRSRLLCLKPDGTGRVVAKNICIANGVRLHGGFVYVTDSQIKVIDGEKPVLVSAVFRFPLDGADIDLGADPLQSPHLVARFDTPIHRDPFGADGIVFDADGRCLVSFFDLGRLVRFPINPDGKAGPIETLIPDGVLPSGDGMAFDGQSGAVYIADPRSNSIHRWHPTDGLSLFSRRGPGEPTPGCLDNPVDVVVREGSLFISNWTSPKRSCAISVLPLKGRP